MWAKIDQKQVLYTWNCTINHRAKNSSTADDCFAPKSKPRLKILRFLFTLACHFGDFSIFVWCPYQVCLSNDEHGCVRSMFKKMMFETVQCSIIWCSTNQIKIFVPKYDIEAWQLTFGNGWRLYFKKNSFCHHFKVFNFEYQLVMLIPFTVLMH